VGKAKLDQALAKYPDHPFAIEWHPFQLNPDMRSRGMDRRTYLETKFGSKQAVVDLYVRLTQMGEEAGINFDFAAIQRTPNSLNAHRLIHWAGIEGRQTAVVSFLFEAYFEKGLDIGDTEVLVALAERAEMDGAATRRLLQGDADVEDIRARDAHTRQRGVSGVPTFVVANQHVLSGAQPPELWEDVIKELSGAPQDGTSVH